MAKTPFTSALNALSASLLGFEQSDSCSSASGESSAAIVTDCACKCSLSLLLMAAALYLVIFQPNSLSNYLQLVHGSQTIVMLATSLGLARAGPSYNAADASQSATDGTNARNHQKLPWAVAPACNGNINNR
jgi:hypothetical protein